MSTELEQQRKTHVGPAGAPTYIGEFHKRYGEDDPILFHSYCKDHPEFGSCGTEGPMIQDAKAHLEQFHGELVVTVPEGYLLVAKGDLQEAFRASLSKTIDQLFKPSLEQAELYGVLVAMESALAVAALEKKTGEQ